MRPDRRGPDASTEQQHPVVWFEVMGRDADELRSFYSQLFGWRFRVDRRRRYATVEGGRGISGGVGRASAGQPRWLTFYAEVPDLPDAIERAVALGGRLLMPPTRLTDTTVAVVADPEGHPVGLCTAG
jgi:predicted enzyme related to lactoylglutathione lyase